MDFKAGIFVVCFMIFVSIAFEQYRESYKDLVFYIPHDNNTVGDNNTTAVSLSFSEAQEFCEKDGATLATLEDKDLQESFGGIVSNMSEASYLRIGGKYYSPDKWTWVSGKPLKGLHVDYNDSGGLGLSEANKTYFYGVVSTPSDKIYARVSSRSFFSVCEYSGLFSALDVRLHGDSTRYGVNSEELFLKRMGCSHHRFVGNVNDRPTCDRDPCSVKRYNKCYRALRKDFYWYEARNACLDEGGDLASFESLNQSTLSSLLYSLYLVRDWHYWIGIQRGVWRWTDTDAEMKYTNWAFRGPSNHTSQCLCVDRQGSWKWITCDCSEPIPFVCSINVSLSAAEYSTIDTRSIVGAVIGIISFAVAIIVLVFAIRLLKSRKLGFANERNDALESGSGNQPRESNAIEFYETVKRTPTEEPSIYQPLQINDNVEYEII